MPFLTNTARVLGLLLVPVILLIASCGDPAEGPYDACVKAEAANDLETAVAKCTKATKLSMTSPKGKLAVRKLAALEPKVADYRVRNMTALTEEFCDSLVGHLAPKVVAALDRKQQDIPPSMRQPPAVLEATALGFGKDKAMLCKDDIYFKKNLGYWKCQWFATPEEMDNCKKDERR